MNQGRDQDLRGEEKSDLDQRLISASQALMWEIPSPTTTKRTTETELAWAAGFFDGEGTTLAAKDGYGRYFLTIALGNTNRVQLDRFVAAVGGAGSITLRKFGKPHWKPFWIWRLSRNAEIKRVVDLLWPYLGDEKRQQIAAAQAKAKRQLPAHFVRSVRAKADVRGHFSTLLDQGLLPEEALLLTTDYRDFLVRTQKPRRTCSEPGCDRAHKARGWCVNHYWHRYRRITLLESQRERPEDAA